MPETTGRHGFMDALPHFKTGSLTNRWQTGKSLPLFKKETS